MPTHHHKPLVSILIPCYNAAKYMSETIDSVLEQTFTNWECIIVDDHSTDNSTSIIQEYVIKHPEKFKLLSNTAKGACAARNLAFDRCQGEYIQYLDADDLLSPDKLKEQIELFNQYGNHIVANCKWGRFSGNKEAVKWEQQSINKDYDNPMDWLTHSWMGNGMAQTATWLTPRNLIEKAGPWDETLQINQDGEFFCRVLMHAKAIKFEKQSGVYYRSGLSSSVSQNSRQSRFKAESLLKSYRNYEKVLTIVDSPEIRKALGNNYLNFIYQFYSLHPHLTQKAEEYFYQLGINKMWSVGGEKFKLIGKVTGFKRALKIKHFISAVFAKESKPN